MKMTLAALIQLQETDDQSRRETRALAEAAASLREAGAGLEKIDRDLAEIRRLQGDEEARQRALEGETADLAVKKKKNENRQMTVKNAGEYTALEKEAAFLAQKISDLEDEGLAILDRLDQRGREIAARAEAAARARTMYENLAAKTGAEEKAAKARLEDMAAKRAGLAETVGPALFKQYEDTARNKGGLAVTAAADGLCLACRLSLPPQFYNELRRNEKLNICPNCYRLVYWRDHPDFQPPDPAEPGPADPEPA